MASCDHRREGMPDTPWQSKISIEAKAHHNFIPASSADTRRRLESVRLPRVATPLVLASLRCSPPLSYQTALPQSRVDARCGGLTSWDRIHSRRSRWLVTFGSGLGSSAGTGRDQR